jgi:aryl-alcohol dehydrogenase-like predicted oxidoreductase
LNISLQPKRIDSTRAISSRAQMRKAEEALSKNKLASNQVEWNLMVRGIEKDLLPYCEQKGIAILPYRPIAHGALANPNKKLKAVMDEISQKHGGKTPAQIALNWLMTKSKVILPIPRASRPERVIENVGSAGWSLDAHNVISPRSSVCLTVNTLRVAFCGESKLEAGKIHAFHKHRLSRLAFYSYC